MFATHSKTHVNHKTTSHPEIETLEGRRLLSADLTAVFASQLPAEFKPGNNANRVAVEVFNDGDSTAAGKVAVDLYAQGVSGQGTVLLGEVSRNVNLQAQRGGVFNFRFGEPLGLVDGNYDLVAQISTSAINDAVTTNDIVTSTAPVAFARPFADVTTTAVKAPAQSIVLQTRETQQWGSVTLENLGNATAHGKVSVTFYLSPKTILDGDAVQAETMVVSINLKAGQAKTFRARLGAPANALGGSYNLFAVTNPINGNVQSLQGHGVGIAVSQVRVTVVSKVVVFPPRTICYSGPDYECTPGEIGGVECTEEPPVDTTPVEPPPADPTPVDPPPSDPAPVDPPPADPTPVDPPPADPAPVDPPPADPAPVDPPPADPAPVDPTPVDGSGDSGSTDSGSTDSGSTDDSSTDSGSTDSGPTDSGPTDNGSTDSGSTDSGPTDNGSTDSGSTDDGSTDSGSTDSGSTDSGSTDSGSTDNGSTDSGSTDSGSTDDGSTDSGSTDDGSTYDGSTDNGSTDDGSTDSGSTDDGSTDSGSTDDGSSDDGSGGDYSEQDFIARRSTKSVSVSVHHVSHAMPSTHVQVAGQRAAERPVSRGHR